MRQHNQFRYHNCHHLINPPISIGYKQADNCPTKFLYPTLFASYIPLPGQQQPFSPVRLLFVIVLLPGYTAPVPLHILLQNFCIIYSFLLKKQFDIMFCFERLHSTWFSQSALLNFLFLKMLALLTLAPHFNSNNSHKLWQCPNHGFQLHLPDCHDIKLPSWRFIRHQKLFHFDQLFVRLHPQIFFASIRSVF